MNTFSVECVYVFHRCVKGIINWNWMTGYFSRFRNMIMLAYIYKESGVGFSFETRTVDRFHTSRMI